MTLYNLGCLHLFKVLPKRQYLSRFAALVVVKCLFLCLINTRIRFDQENGIDFVCYLYKIFQNDAMMKQDINWSGLQSF